MINDIADSKKFTMLYGIGAMKSGTTWIYDYLSKHPDCHFCGIKEMHYFDVLCKSEMSSLRRRIQPITDVSGSIDLKLGKDFDKKVNHLLHLVKVLSIYTEGFNHSRYIDMLLEGYSGEKIIGDITPSYACLSRSDFQEMDSVFSNSLYVFIMRDPVDRLWSAIRMQAKEEGVSGDSFERRCVYLANNIEKNPLALSRSDYKHTIQELEASINSSRILYLFYEDLFGYSSIEKLCDFLGIEFYSPNLSIKVNAGRDHKLSFELAEKLRGICSEQYEFIEKKFGNAIPSSWL